MPRLRSILPVLLLGFLSGAGLERLFPGHRSVARSPESAGARPPVGSSGPLSSKPQAADPSDTPRPATSLPLPTVTLAEVLAAEDPERIMKLALWLPGADSEEIAAVYESIVSGDDQCINSLQLDLIFQRWVTIDHEAAFRAGRATTTGKWKCYEAWGRLDPQAAWQGAKDQDRFTQKSVMEGIASSDPALAAELLKEWKDPIFLVGTNIIGEIAGGLARTDPLQAANYMLMHRSYPATDLALWFQTEPDAAQTWALSQPTAQLKTEALGRLVSQWKTAFPEKILPLLATLPEGQSKWTVQAAYVRGLADSDPDAALAYAAGLDSPLAREGILQGTAASLAGGGKREMALRILRSLDWSQSTEGWNQPSVISGETPGTSASPSKAVEALKYLAEDSLPETLAITEAIPPGTLRDQALTAVAESWPHHGMTVELSEWLVTQTAPSVREAGARNLVLKLLREPEPDFDAAMRWAATLPPPAENAEGSYLREVLDRWTQADPAAAATAEAELPPAVRETLEKRKSP